MIKINNKCEEKNILNSFFYFYDEEEDSFNFRMYDFSWRIYV
jgi:hypothetical protein